MTAIERLVTAALRAPALVGLAAIAVVLGGVVAFHRLDIEAYPNPVPPMIDVIAQPPGWSAEEVERYVTIPLETALAGMPDLVNMRSQSLFGLADVKSYFSWDVDYWTAQQRVINRLENLALPNDIQPTLSPWNAIGEIYRYQVTGPGYSLADLKTAQDWILERQFRHTPGVADVVGFGGLTKQYLVEVDPFRLRGQGVSVQQLLDAVGNANRDVGGQRLSLGEQSFVVRGVGLIRSLPDIEQVSLMVSDGIPVRVADVATVRVGAAPRLGLVGKDGDADIVEGIVLMRYGASSLDTIRGVHQRIDRIRDQRALPPGMEITPIYDRTDLVRVTTHTVFENLLVGMLLVASVLWLFLGELRAAALTALNLPLALLVAFIGMKVTGIPANLLSIGAVDFGIVVESTVIMVETISRKLAEPVQPGGDREANTADAIRAAAHEVGRPLLSSTLIIAVAFIPLFTLTGVAGVIFAPMARTYAFAIGGAGLLAVTLTPVLAARLLKRKAHAHDEPSAEGESWLMRKLLRVYRPLFAFAIDRARLAAVVVGGLVVLLLAAANFLGREFMPKLEEGNFWIRATLPISISLEQASSYVGRMRAIVLGCPGQDPAQCPRAQRARPEIQTVVSHLGRPDDGTDVGGFYNLELFAPLSPKSEWRRGITKATLTEALSRELEGAFPGVDFNFSQAISDNVEEAMSGVKGENTVKVVGPDVTVNEAKAREILEVMTNIRGVADLGIFRSLGQPAVRITPDRVLAARYGLNVGDVETVVEAAIGGRAVTQVYEQEKHFDLTVRWAPQYRQSPEAIRNLLVPTPDGAQVPLAELASVVEETGPAVIFRENNARYVPVKFSVRGRDLGSAIAEAQRAIEQRVKLPYGTHLEWAGEMDELRDTMARLVFIVPLTLVLIAILVYSTVRALRETLIVLTAIPTAWSGGVAALFLTGTHFSIAASMGFISLLGLAVQDALLVVTGAQRAWAAGAPVREGVRSAAERFLRPALMAGSVALLGLLPAAVSQSLGAETQKPLAVVVIGGALALALLTRVLQPALLVWLRSGRKRA